MFWVSGMFCVVAVCSQQTHFLHRVFKGFLAFLLKQWGCCLRRHVSSLLIAQKEAEKGLAFFAKAVFAVFSAELLKVLLVRLSGLLVLPASLVLLPAIPAASPAFGVVQFHLLPACIIPAVLI